MCPLSVIFPLLLAVLVGHVTLRMLKPECDLDEDWEQEDLDTATHRTILLLHNHTVPQREAKTGGEQNQQQPTQAVIYTDSCHRRV